MKEYLDLAAKGRGEAILALRDGRWNPSEKDLLRLVLRFTGADSQMEDSRGWYTVELISASKFEADLSHLAIRALKSKKAHAWDRSHREAVVLELAQRGSQAARAAMYAAFDSANDFRMSYEILAVDGFAGLVWLVRNTKTDLTHAEAWSWVNQLEDLLGKAAVEEWLQQTSTADPVIAEFARLAASYKASAKQRIEEPDDVPLSFEEFRSRLPIENRIYPRLWVVRASETEVEKAWRAFESADETDWPSNPRDQARLPITHLIWMAKALRRKPQAANLDKLIERAKAWQGDPNPFIEAMADMTDARLRQLALDLIDSGCLFDGLELLAKNAVPADSAIILNALDTLTDKTEIHWAAMDLLHMHDEIELQPFMLWIYEQTHCSFCRERAVQKLIDNGQADEALLRECLLDCNSDLRNLAKQSLETTT